MTVTARADAPLAVPAMGAPFRGELIAADDRWRLTFRLPHQQWAMLAADLVSWGQPVEQGRGGGLVLSDGSLLAADIVAADRENVSADSAVFGKIQLLRQSLSGLVFRWPSNRSDRDKLLERFTSSRHAPRAVAESSRHAPRAVAIGRDDRLAQVAVGWDKLAPASAGPPSSGRRESASGEDDGGGPALATRPGPTLPMQSAAEILLLDNGDELTGSLLAIADNTVNFQTEVGSVAVKSDRIKAIVFNPARDSKQPAGLHAWLGFRDGTRLLATRLLVAGQSLDLTASGQRFRAAASSLVFLQPLGGRAVYLSDLAPSEYHQTPYLDDSSRHAPRAVAWPYRNDRNVTGELLRSNKRLYLKGLSVHSAARLVYAISPLPLGEGQGVRAVFPTRFAAEIAIDDSTEGQGSVQFRVLVDGQEKYVSPTIRGGAPPLPVSVDVAGAKKLELIVDYADKADVQDHADWLDARLIQ